MATSLNGKTIPLLVAPEGVERVALNAGALALPGGVVVAFATGKSWPQLGPRMLRRR